MSEKLYSKIINDIDDNKYFQNNICLLGDREDFLYKMEALFIDKKLTAEEYDGIVKYVEDKTEELPDCIWEAMVECNPDLAD